MEILRYDAIKYILFQREQELEAMDNYQLGELLESEDLYVADRFSGCDNEASFSGGKLKRSNYRNVR